MFRKIRPCGICSPDECNLLFASPAEFLFARNSCGDFPKNFNLDQTLDPVPGGEAPRVVVRFVLQNAPSKMPAHSDVERERAACHDVHVVGFRFLHARSISGIGTLDSDGLTRSRSLREQTADPSLRSG
jgi:hypothetical protein